MAYLPQMIATLVTSVPGLSPNRTTAPALEHLACRYISLPACCAESGLIETMQCKCRLCWTVAYGGGKQKKKEANRKRKKGSLSQRGHREWKCESERHRERGHFITFIARPPSPSTLSRVNVEEDIQHLTLWGKPSASEEHMCLLTCLLAALMLNVSVKTVGYRDDTLETNPAQHSHGLDATHTNWGNTFCRWNCKEKAVGQVLCQSRHRGRWGVVTFLSPCHIPSGFVLWLLNPERSEKNKKTPLHSVWQSG